MGTRGVVWLHVGLLNWRKPETQREVPGSPTHHSLCPLHLPGEPYISIKAYTAVEEDEMSLSEGEAIEVIHKLLDGWWVVR